MMSADPIAALQLATRAYGASAGGGVSDTAGSSAAAAGGGFGSMVAGFAHSQLNVLRNSEHTMAQAVAGKIDPQSMVEAASNAQVTVQALVSVLSKATSAYNDVMHMST